MIDTFKEHIILIFKIVITLGYIITNNQPHKLLLNFEDA